MRVLRLFRRFPRLHRMIHRGPDACVLCRHVWKTLESQPGFNEALARAGVELAAGRGVRYPVDEMGE